MDNLLLTDRIDTAIRVFFYILIFWLPYSPAVVESCVISGLILWIIKRSIILAGARSVPASLGGKLSIILKSFKPEPTFLNTPIGLFLFACVLSVTSSAFFAQSFHNFLTKTLEWFVVYFLVVEAFKEKKHIYIALGILTFTALSTVLDSFFQYYITGKDIFLGRVIELKSRATAGFKTPNGLGAYLTVIIPCLSAWVILGKQKEWYRLGGLLILIFSLWSLTITFSRGAWIGTFFGGVFLLFFVLFYKKRLPMYFSVGIFWATAVLFIAFFLILADSLGLVFSRYQTIDWRFGIWMESLKMIKDKMLFGHGINTFMRVFQAYRENPLEGPTYAHNCYIQLAAEVGIAGLICFFGIIAKIFHCSLGKIKLYSAQEPNLAAFMIGLLSGICAFLIHSFFDTNFYSLQLSVYLWLMIGILVAVSNIANAQEIV